LRRCLPAGIGRALNELPKSLDETYERTLLGIEEEKREFAHRLFQCLTVSVRPLRVDELAEVLAIRFNPGQLPQYHVDWQSDDAQEAVLSTCSSLIFFVNVDGSPVVQFSHFSVKEFLTSDRLAKSMQDLSRFHVVPYSAHTILAQACLSVLLHISDKVDKDSIKKFPFAQYAAQHWVDHGRFENVSSKIQDAMERFFDENEPSFATWIWIYDIDYPFRQHMFEDRPSRPEASAIYYATLCGFRNLVEHLITNRRGDINARGGQHGSAVNAAIVKRHVEITVLLLGQGADVNIMDAFGCSPLYLASENGRRDDVELLLKHHADVHLVSGPRSMTALRKAALVGEVEISQALLHHGAAVDAPCDQGWTPLKGASRHGHLDVVRLLIQNDAAVDTPDNEGWTPLKIASRHGYLDTVQLLIHSGAAVDTQDNEGWTALKVASRHGHLDIVRLLMQSDAAVDTQDNNGWTPLKVASRRGHRDIVRLLIQSGAAVDTPDNEGTTPLFEASRYGHLDIVQLLVRSCAAVDTPNKEGATPLIVASRNGHHHVAQVLIDHDAAINAQTTGLSTPLHHSSAEGHLGVVQLLIEHHADLYKRDKDQQTPLDLAAANGRLEIARLLLKSGSSPNSQDKNGSIPLHTAAHNGHLDLVKLLVESGADVNLRNVKNQIPLDVALASRKSDVTRYLANHMGVMDPCDGVDISSLDKTPDNLVPDTSLASVTISKHRNPHGGLSLSSLHDACAKGSVEDVQSLLDQGADINGRDTHHKTALAVESRVGKLEVVKVLIKYGADVNCRDKTGWTPLMAASRHGHREIAELLLNHGADVNARKEDFWTALHLASTNFHIGVVKVLFDNGADIHARNIDGRTPSGLASRTGGQDIILLLSGVKVESPTV
jgi:ankyrin repeat protein